MGIHIRLSKAGTLILLALVSLSLLGVSSSWAIVVNSTADSGTGSLRAAIQAANADGVATVITFDPAVFPPPPALPGVISLQSALPNITGTGDTIDGTGAGVVLDGTNLPVDTGLRVRASNVTINEITLQNFVGNDAVRVEARNATPVVTGVLITANTFLNNRRAIRIDGGNQTNNTTVSASVLGNTLADNITGIVVFGNVAGSDGGNNVSALIDGNSIRGKQIQPFVGGDGIDVIAGTDIGSNNNVSATVSNNNLVDIPDDGVVISGCGADDTGSFNTVNATVTGNVIRYKNDNSPANFRNQGIVVTGAAGESDLFSRCTDNSVTFEVYNNNVEGFKNNNIIVSGGDELTARNDVSGIISGNTATNSRGTPGQLVNRGGTGIHVTAGSGSGHSVHDITVVGNKTTGNPLRGIFISGGSGADSTVTRINVSANTVDGTPPSSPQFSIVPEADQTGIFVTGGANALNSTVSEILLDGNNIKKNLRDGINVTQGDASNTVSLSGITNNMTAGSPTNNGRDGIGIRSGVPGSGTTPVSGNRSDRNGQDGIDINSDGYILSNNRADRNTGAGINAFGAGNSDGGGNRGRFNGSCNEPNFC